MNIRASQDALIFFLPPTQAKTASGHVHGHPAKMAQNSSSVAIWSAGSFLSEGFRVAKPVRTGENFLTVGIKYCLHPIYMHREKIFIQSGSQYEEEDLAHLFMGHLLAGWVVPDFWSGRPSCNP